MVVLLFVLDLAILLVPVLLPHVDPLLSFVAFLLYNLWSSSCCSCSRSARYPASCFSFHLVVVCTIPHLLLATVQVLALDLFLLEIWFPFLVSICLSS